MTAEQLDILTAVADNPHPWAAMQRERIREAIRHDARTHGGEVDSNRVRAALSNAVGLQVNPRVLSATYAAMRAEGLLEHAGWVTNDDRRGRNAGRPQRLWRMVGAL